MSLARKYSPYRKPTSQAPYLPRSVGLSRNQPGVRPLLSLVGSVIRTDTKAAESKDAKQLETRNTLLAEKRGANATEGTKARVVEKRDKNSIVNKQLAKVKMLADDDPPVSSSDDEGPSQGDVLKTEPLSDEPIFNSSDDEGPSRGDIHRVNFKSSQKPNSPQSVSTRPKRQAPQASRTSARTKSSQGSQPSSSASRKLIDEEDADELSELSTNSRKRKSPETTGLGTHLGDGIFPKAKRGGVGYGKSAKSAIKIPKGFSPKKQKESPKKPGIKAPPKDFFENRQDSSSPRRGIVIPPGLDSSPIRGSSDRKRLKQSLGREKPKVESPEEPRRELVIPKFYSDTFDEKDEVFKDEESNTTEAKDMYIIDSPKSSKPVCTMCDAEVDEAVRRKFDKKNPGSGFSLRREQLFCVYHKKDSARKTWKTKGYPEIKWKRLDKRIEKQYDFLQAILEGGQSYYGDIFNNSVKSGKNRTLLKSDQNMTPGYYGIRGLRVMTDNLTYKFSQLLRERAVQDRLISARGYMAYMQSVLVPELAVQLIKEDMSVSDEKARSIMEESCAVGELLNEEEKDIVLESDDEGGSDHEIF